MAAYSQNLCVRVINAVLVEGMTRLYGWAPRGHRLVDKVPHGHWKTAAFLAALRNDRIEAPCLFDGPINGQSFLAYVEQFLVPTLKPQDVVVLDNLGSHKGKATQAAIKAAGAHLIFVPKYSADLNPIEQLFSKLKAFVRTTAPRSQEAVLGSENVVHNLRRVQWNMPDSAFDWAERFDDAVVAQMAKEPADILKIMEHPDCGQAVPTPEHFIPLLYLAGLAAAEGSKSAPIMRGYSMGSLSMTCHALGGALICEKETGAAALPSDIPADQTNT